MLAEIRRPLSSAAGVGGLLRAALLSVLFGAAGWAGPLSLAWAPPAPGVPNLLVPRHCVPYGVAFTVLGTGFGSGANVDLGSPAGHYDGPPLRWTVIESKTVVADETGGFRAQLTAPPAPPAGVATFSPRIVIGSISGASSYDAVLFTTRATCRRLLRTAGHERHVSRR